MIDEDLERPGLRDEKGRFILGHHSLKKRNNKNNTFLKDCLMVHSNKYGNIKVKLSPADVTTLREMTWSLDCRLGLKYIHTTINGKKVYLHRFISEAQPDDIIDHINQDTLDCRRENLRKVTKSINALNRKITAHRRRNKWGARVKIDDKYHHLGVYNTEEQAVEVKTEYLRSLGISR